MAAEHESVLFDVLDVKVFPLTSDSAGASPVYGAGVDVYGANEISLDPNLVTAELKGDSRVIAKKGRIDRMNASVTYGRLSIDVLDVIAGAVVTDPSATQARGRLLAGTELPYFGMVFRIADADNGIEDVLPRLYKCQITGGTFLGQSSDNFGQPSFDIEAIGLDCAGVADWESVMADLDFYTEETAITMVSA